MAFWFNRMKKGGGTRSTRTTAPLGDGAATSDAAATDAPAPAAAADLNSPAASGASTAGPAAGAGAGAGASPAGGPGGTPAAAGGGASGGTGSGGTTGAPRSVLGRMTDRMLAQGGGTPPPSSALNPKIVQAVQLSNAETRAYAPSQIATGPDMMVSQAAGLVAQSAAAYFDGVSKLALASQGVLLKDMTESLVNQQIEKAAEDALGVLATDVMMGAAAAVAAAAGAMEAESASFAIDRIDQSIAKYSDLLSKRAGKG